MAALAVRRMDATVGSVIAVAIMLWLMLSLRPAVRPAQSMDDIAVDMHCHTTESDGDRTAEEQLKEAARIGLDALWITDHDMIRDLPRTREIQKAAKKAGVGVGFGVEITVEWEKKEHHLLGYFPDSAWSARQLSPEMVTLQRECAKVKTSRETRNNNMVSFLNTLLASDAGKPYFISADRHAAFKPLVVNEVAEWAKENANLMEPTSLGRPHFRAYLIEVVGIREDLIFGPRAGDGVATLTADGDVFYDEDREGKTGVELEALMHSATLAKRDIAFRPLPIIDAIKLINAAGGRAVLAHPPTLGSKWKTVFVDKVGDLAAAGLWGIEAFSSEIDEENHAIIAGLAQKYNLVMTAGSDNHGSLKIYAHLGEVKRHGTAAYAELEYWARHGLRESARLQNEEL
ncbi:hypothetical protein PTSG_10473 [Salpingoeca rosetta]|uniref:Polymerase/histidinol phosphatase N-terminal domain-containing protein n=1 Tax=Salpingoeca rosetta (strain ATCC 50818 / BSB-021) TaxID=946362 RepID=F2UPS0_SALR5|nr:uncharacterized protein PTSG_10473 [Salpingoeca rosetta]EGD79625.1 hypothetical protein PTSG_10473 [Salpingoeca rosetta]|eukprot:XP_004988853.1 hypothetical protein PTSG_10473 [Salpingoeca rosetta]